MSENPQSAPAQRYTAELAGQIETKWQDRWEELGTFYADNPTGDLAGPLASHNPFFILDMFPYPSGKGLHVGHPLGYIATDTLARYRRMKGDNVLYTMGYDAFGLPAEQYAVQTGQHPAITTNQNIANMRRQLRRMGLSHDSRRSFATTDIEYVHWTQWIFLQVFNSWFDPQATAPDGSQGAARPISELIAKLESGEIRPEDGSDYNSLDRAAQAKVVDSYRLAYVSEAPVNWCPGLGTVLANEEVTADGRSERGNFPVFKRNLRQWMMRITAYGKRLADDLDTINWPEKVRTMQRNWIGRSEGATVRFDVPGAREVGASLDSLDVYTTRPDTLFGATFMVVAPEHPILGGTAGGDAGDEAALTLPASWPEGTKDAWTGGAASPKEAVAAYRAQASAKSEAERADEERTKTGVFTGLLGIDPVNGREVPIFVADYVLWGYGTGAIMAVPAHDDRDWAFARAYDLDVVRTIGPADDPYGPDLEVGAYTGDGVAVDSANDEIDLNGLAKDEAKAAMTAWLEAKGLGKRTITYRLRDWLFSRQRYWGEPFPIVWDEDGVEHAVLHLLYARFWQKVLFDLGHVPDSEPYHTLFNQGYVQAYAYTDARGQYVPADEVEGDETSGFTYKGEPVGREYGKMGKSLKNIVTPDEMYDAYGADVFRVYEMSMGPLDLSRPWETRAVVGSQRFLQRLWRNAVDEETGELTVTDEPADDKTRRLVARTIAEVTEEYENLRINTAISKLIVLNNHLTSLDAVPRDAIEPLILMLAPVAPHLCEELWSRLGHEASLAREPFPVVEDSSLLIEDTVTAVIQVNGKVKARIEVAPSISEEDLIAAALAEAPIVKALGGADPLKVIARAPKLVNVVVKK